MMKQSSRYEASSFIWHKMAQLFRLTCLISPFRAAKLLFLTAVGYLIVLNFSLTIFLYLQLLLPVSNALSNLCVDVT